MTPRACSSSWAIALLLLAGGCTRQGDTAKQAAAPDEAAGAPSPSPAGAFDRNHRGEAAPALAFTGPDGGPVTLARFRGRPLLVNLWATWCAPCVAEMPTLDRLAAAGGVQVVAVSQDMDGLTKVRPFLAAHGLRNIRPYADPKLSLSVAYAANLPTTILYDARGREVWRHGGGLDWTGPEARRALAEAG